jgi:SepF-like predicted cell division protein (DUF552 family)
MEKEGIKKAKLFALRTGLLSSALLLSGCTNVSNTNTQAGTDRLYIPVNSQVQYEQLEDATALIYEENNILIVKLLNYECSYASRNAGISGGEASGTYRLITIEGDILNVHSYNTIIITGNNSYEKAKNIATALIDETGIIYDYNEQMTLKRK